jgi:hypothetical protein
MIFAIVNNIKVEAKPNLSGVCPLCASKLIPKCGEINVWHWAHYGFESCDSWHEPETEWHKNWKLTFGFDNCEIKISSQDGHHIADIYTKDRLVIELQNSSIQSSVINERECFYGDKMIWIINGKSFKNNFSIFKPPFEEEDEYYRLHNPLSKDYGKLVNPTNNEFNFKWSRCRKVWSFANRPIFIDFEDSYLYWITEGMGTSSGKCKKILKSQFVLKYGGDINLLSTIV